ncbi:PorP/SprF family type IX secretion system membrane protein [Abyssalbus ytuae]|uniref:Type IX secretion system membrane protein PorP/SprF n=1 Tax=Abyssalbus ytuae TaxID=2926907 RepID=A0A9E7D2N7_9FLAO|nr:type IX secretion system membrane protein PorP/SprF [Abyssalbus ytuae]UOB16884.1 type IX secretion system membrane protein PorP/SprF [Abyssalbus ytuae]
MRKCLFMLMIMAAPVLSFSQQDAQYTQYMYNTMSVNPAYAGSRGALSISGLHRSQWVGLEGAPVTQTFNIHSPVGKSVGLGFSVVNDKIGEGVNQDTYFDVLFSYTISTSEEGKLSFGVKGGGHLLDVDFSVLSQYVSELNAINNIDNKFSPNIGAGIYYHTNKFYLGFSVPNFLETEHFDASSNSNESASFIAEDRMNFYLISGYVFQLSDSWDAKPAVLAKWVDGSPFQLDLSANFWYNERLTLGGAYRLSAAWSFLAGFQVSDSFMVGLAYDREVTDLGNTSFNDGSFEIFLRFELFKNLDKIISPRFF